MFFDVPTMLAVIFYTRRYVIRSISRNAQGGMPTPGFFAEFGDPA